MYERAVVLIAIGLGFVITFSTLFFHVRPTIEQAIVILDNTLASVDVVPEKGFYYNVNHKKGVVTKFNK